MWQIGKLNIQFSQLTVKAAEALTAAREEGSRALLAAQAEIVAVRKDLTEAREERDRKAQQLLAAMEQAAAARLEELKLIMGSFAMQR